MHRETAGAGAITRSTRSAGVTVAVLMRAMTQYNGADLIIAGSILSAERATDVSYRRQLTCGVLMEDALGVVVAILAAAIPVLIIVSLRSNRLLPIIKISMSTNVLLRKTLSAAVLVVPVVALGLQGPAVVRIRDVARFQPGVVANVFPIWTRGVFIAIANNRMASPVLRIFDRTGQEMSPIAFTIPGSSFVEINGVSRAEDGGLAVCGRAIDQDGREAGFVGWISSDHQSVRTFRTFPYIPYMLTIAPDGKIWTQGVEMANGQDKDPAINRKNGVIRRFDSTSGQEATFFPQATVFSGKWMGLPNGRIVSNKDRIGWYAAIAQEYFERTYNGTVAVYPGFATANSRRRLTGLSLLDNEEVVASAQELVPGSGVQTFLYHLERKTASWVPLRIPNTKMPPRLFGSDDNELALHADDEDTFKIQFVKITN